MAGADVAPRRPRTTSVFMNTTVVRGRAELVVTATGMGTEMGKVAELLGGGRARGRPRCSASSTGWASAWP